MISASMQYKTANYGSVVRPDSNDRANPAPTSATTLSAAVACCVYLTFHLTFVWMTLFTLPKSFLPEYLSAVPTLDSADIMPFWPAVALDLVLISAFGILHSVFARRPVKKYMGIPQHYERTFHAQTTHLQQMEKL